MRYYLIKFGCQGIKSSEDTLESHILITWAPTVTLTLKIANNFFSTWHSGSWCCITVPSLVTKCSAVQKVPPAHTLTSSLNLCCGLNLQCSNPKCPQTTLVYDAVLPNPVWLQTDQLFTRWPYLDCISPRCDLDTEDSKPIFLHDILAHDVALPYQIWYQNDLRFRRY